MQFTLPSFLLIFSTESAQTIRRLLFWAFFFHFGFAMRFARSLWKGTGTLQINISDINTTSKRLAQRTREKLLSLRGRVRRFLVFEHLAGLKFFFQNRSSFWGAAVSELLALKQNEVKMSLLDNTINNKTKSFPLSDAVVPHTKAGRWNHFPKPFKSNHVFVCHAFVGLSDRLDELANHWHQPMTAKMCHVTRSVCFVLFVLVFAFSF